MTADQKARLGAGTSGRSKTSGAAAPSSGAPSKAQVLQLLALLAYLQQQSAGPNANAVPASQKIVPLDRVAATKYVGQAVADFAVTSVADRALDFLKQNTEAAALGALGLGGVSVAGIGAGLEASLAGVAAAAPVGAVATAIGGLALGLFDAFGGDFSIPTYATTPQLDATTALGQAAARKAAIRIKTNLAAGVGKYSDAGDYALATLGG